MARVTLKVEGELRNISLDSFLLVLRESHSILQELDRALSKQRNGTLKWVVAGLQEGSAVVKVESRVIRGDEDHSLRVAQHFIDGIHTIQNEAVTPALFSLDTMTSMRRIVRYLGTNGVSALEVIAPDLNKSVELSSESSDKIQALVGVHHKSIGSVEGRLELISIHARDRRFNVYHAITSKAVRCNLPNSMEQEVVGSLGRRISVSGLVSFNSRGEPIRVDVNHLRVFKEEGELPSIAQILGLVPDITGDLTTEEHFRELRDG